MPITQDQLSLVPIDSIIVGDRFRRDYGDIDALCTSISLYGLLENLVIDQDNNLVAGGRRLVALQKLGWRFVPVVRFEQLDDLRRRKIELEENIQRKDLLWPERAALTKAIDDLNRQIYGSADTGIHTDNASASPQETGWSVRRTATEMNVTHPTVINDIRLANALELHPDLAKQTSRTNALRELDRLEELIVNEQDRRARIKQYSSVASSFILGDSTSLILRLETDSVDCIITDPPYGLDLRNGRFASRDGDNDDFDDSPENALALLRSIAPECRRVLKPSGHLYAFFGAHLWDASQSIWRAAGFDVRDLINIWYKTGPATGAGDWDHFFAPAWEPFLFASNAERRLAFKHKNVFPFAPELGSLRYHPTQKPIELLRELLQLSTSLGDLVFDPFAGVGSTLVAASQLRRRFYGIELNSRFHAIGLRRLVDEGRERPFVAKQEL